MRGFRCVLQAKADGNGAPAQAVFDFLFDGGELLGRGALLGTSGIGGGQERGPVTHYTDAGWDVTNADAEIDGGLALAQLVPRVHIRRADFQFEGRGDAVHRLERVILWALAVLMQVHKARGHDEALGVDGGFAFEWGF